MKILRLFVMVLLVYGLVGEPLTPAFAARASGRVAAGARKSTPSVNVNISNVNKLKSNKASSSVLDDDDDWAEDDDNEATSNDTQQNKGSGNCREDYRQCMDEFCLLDESEGNRCACSDNINQSKSLIQEIQKIQSEADLLYTEGVEREQLGASAAYVFGESEKAKKSSRASGLSFSDWLNSSTNESDSLGDDADIGDGLYSMATDYCAYALEECDGRGEMEEKLYSRMVVQDCKSFESYLADQKRNAEANKRTAEKAVRTARAEMMKETQKYNRGTCLLAYKACIADKGGCGTKFENCLDKDLLDRRAHACDNILDQCTAVREYVLQDWEGEAEYTLKEAKKYSKENQLNTCRARILNCLEENCATETDTLCLSDINIAAGICPVIDECDKEVKGLKAQYKDKLGEIRTRFCQNDVDKCLRDKCGDNFTNPACLGKGTSAIVKLCPQDMFTSCKNEKSFDIIVSAILLQMDYQMMQGCINYFSEELGKVCGTDMACLPEDLTIANLKSSDLNNIDTIRATVRTNTSKSVNDFFKKFEKDITVKACQSSDGGNLGKNVFNSAKMIAEEAAINRAVRELDTKISKIVRAKNLKEAEQRCLTLYKPETPSKSENKNYSYISSVNFEPSLSNCHVCRKQQVCAVGGESKATSALKAAAGGLSAGASAGTMINAGWGTAIGGVVGAVGAGILGYQSGGEKDFCQELESCEDVNISIIDEDDLSSGGAN